MAIKISRRATRPRALNAGGPLHSHLMHAQDRSNPRQLQTSDGLKHLNEMPVYFAHEILRLGEAFEEELGKTGNPADEALQELACEKRKETINNAECVVNSTIAQQHAEEKQQTLKPVFGF